MNEQIHLLVASDSSPAALDAVRCAMGLATRCGGKVRVTAVTSDDGTIEGTSRSREDEERALAYVTRLGQEQGLEMEVETIPAAGREPYEVILDVSAAWGADFVFMGRTGRRGPGRALMGSQTEHVLEFSEVPVIVVPTRFPT
jgi:nucleotide-binding universal stress UspA family protein